MRFWLKDFFWPPFALAYLTALTMGLYTVGVVMKWPGLADASPLGVWVKLALLHAALAIIAVIVVHERHPYRMNMAMLHAVIGLVICPAAVLLPLWWLGGAPA